MCKVWPTRPRYSAYSDPHCSRGERPRKEDVELEEPAIWFKRWKADMIGTMSPSPRWRKRDNVRVQGTLRLRFDDGECEADHGKSRRAKAKGLSRSCPRLVESLGGPKVRPREVEPILPTFQPGD